MDKNRVNFTILGNDYTILSGSLEEEAYILKTAKLVEEESRKILENSGVSQVGALVYAAMNIADLYYKEQGNTENLRVQITEFADANTKLEKELNRQKPSGKKEKKEHRESKEKKEEKIVALPLEDEKILEDILMEEVQQLREDETKEETDATLFD